ncbi:MAG TPA: chemotaxis protein, partial [Janthinobacterium sp.]|nr:chemotaxis protein [Janthinobacterium sp.]
ALVEQAAAAAESLQEQAVTLSQMVGVFRLGDDAAAPAVARAQVAVAQAAAPRALAPRPAAPRAAPPRP